MALSTANAPMEAIFPPSASSDSSSPGTPSSSSSPSPSPPPEIAGVKDGRRQRFLRGIQRMSSSSSLPKLGRSRSSSAPYGNRANLSCVTLGPAVPPNQPSQPSPGNSTPISGPGPSTGLSGARPITVDDADIILAPRRATLLSSSIPSSTTATLPAVVTITRPRYTKRPHLYDLWASLPTEIRVMIFSYLKPKELVRVSRVSKEFHRFCFDGQLWKSIDTSEFYSLIPADSLANIISSAGPFIKDLNVRGCLQIEHNNRAEVLVSACKNLINASLEGCRNFQRPTLHNLIRSNIRLANLNLASMTAVTNSTCKIIAQHCPQLETLNVSWCKYMDAKGVKMVVAGCSKLKDLRASEIRGFGDIEVAKTIFETNNLQRLVLSGCDDLTDEAFKTMVHGVQPEIDILTDRPIVPARKLRHLDLSRCSLLTNRGVTVLSQLVPDLEGLLLNGCHDLSDAALEPIIASTPRLTHLELEDMSEITNDFFSKHLAKAPCAAKLEHLSVSYCENVNDSGMLPIVRNCVGLRNLDMDNTGIGDLVLAEATSMMRGRAARTTSREEKPRIGLRLVIFDCNLVTWSGIREILSWNAAVRLSPAGEVTYPTEVIGLKCYFGWQQTVDEHTHRVLKGDFASASRLDRKWADYMIAVEEAGAIGAGRRRRRRAREAQFLHADEEEGGLGGFSRRRARTIAAACTIM